MKKYSLLSLLIAGAFFIFSCVTPPEPLPDAPPLPEPAPEPEIVQDESLTLLFAGDIMAHTPNYNMQDYRKIWEAVTPLVSSCDLSFANIESPVVNGRPFSGYPDFNMQNTYPEAAIAAGFNVFSTANNHSNDQGLEGILETRAWAAAVQEKYRASARPLFFSGIRDEKGGAFTYQVIRKDGWTILFCAVTELLNRPFSFTDYLNYVPSKEEARAEFKAFVQKLRAEHPCDLFVLSVHSDEAEYIADFSDARERHYRSLLDAGIDIIWANHPHVVRDWQIYGQKDAQRRAKLVMYGNGNTISAQRTKPQFASPATPRDDTGDGLLLKVTVTKRGNEKPVIAETTPYFITTYITPAREFVIRFLDDDFISSLKTGGRADWAHYLMQRKQITEKHKEKTVWQ